MYEYHISEPTVDGWMWSGHNRYWFGNKAVNHSHAVEICKEKGSILATVEDSPELNFYGKAAFSISGYRPRNLLVGRRTLKQFKHQKPIY